MALLHHRNSFIFSMKLSSPLPWSFPPTPPPSFNLFLSIAHPRFLFLKKLKESHHLCHCSSQSSSAQQLQDLVVAEDDGSGGGGGGDGLDGHFEGDGKGQFGNLVREYGWQVRRMVEEDDEMRRVADIQAEAFYEPVILFNDAFFDFFQADVLSGLLYRLRNSPPDRYACLVAEPITCENQLVGVVDCTVFRDEPVLKHLSGAEEYLYVSGIAVLRKFRRRKVASALLKACEALALLWGYEYLVLRAYEDDWGARKLYTNAGYTVMSGDSLWTTTWIGRRRRVLMIKKCNKI